MTQPRIRITSIGGSGDGQQGDPGESAYQIAVNNGFIGTEQEWLNSLIGEAGPAGADGQDGADALWNFTGAYNLGASYAVGDVVTYEGQTWYRIDSHGGNTGDTPTEGIFWTLVAQKGIDGQDGEQGPQGEQGDPGIGIPPGGDAGDILAKIDGTDYNTEWIQNYTSTIKHQVKAGVALTKGQAVYVTSSTGNDGTNMIVGKASNSGEATSSKTMGLIDSDLAINDFGYVITEGLLSGLNTDSANAGDPVWLGTDGNLIYGLAAKPVAPAHLVFIGIVTRKNQNNGEIFVKVQNGFEIDELHNVLIGTGYSSTPADKDILAYENSSGLWKNKTASELGLQTIVSGVSNTEIGYLDGVTSSIQSQINSKQDVVGNVSSTEIGYLDGVTSSIQTQLNAKADLLSPTITMATLASANSSIDPLTISTDNGHGGTGYAGLITLENSIAGVTNPKKFIRMNNVGSLEVVNDAYSQTIFVLENSGNLTVSGYLKGAPGTVVKDTMLTNSELNVISTTIARTSSNVNFVTYNYTPVSSSSYLLISFHLSKYIIGGSIDDDYYSILLADGNEIAYGYQRFNDDGGGTNGRSGVLFPLMGRYTNSSTSAKTIAVAARRGSADDNITIDSGTPQTMCLRITEVVR